MNNLDRPLILAIDTSCDDTSVAVTRGRVILSNIIASQTQLHAQFGGVFPTVAKQAHRENLPASIVAALRRARVGWDEIDAIAVTQGPGLAPALEVGLVEAKTLAATHHKPLIAVNHLEGHLLSTLALPRTQTVAGDEKLALQFPILGLIFSGGHSEFVLIHALGKCERLGWTIDDSVGEVLDKVGRMLSLGYPAGPIIEEFAVYGNDHAFTFPLPMTTSGDYNLSFSGMKTFARNTIEKLEAENTLTKTQIFDFCASFQRAVFRAICYKMNKIILKHQFREVWLGGGVARNNQLRVMIRQTMKKSQPSLPALRVPYSKVLCSDNAAMIGVVAGYKFERGEVVRDSFEAIERQPKWRISKV